MDCEFVDEDFSSGPNSCHTSDGEKDERGRFDPRRVKSLSMSRLPDRVSDFFDGASSTLPAKLSSVQQFNPNLSEGISVNAWYDPEESFSSEESSSDADDALDENPEQILPNHDEDQDLFPDHENVSCVIIYFLKTTLSGRLFGNVTCTRRGIKKLLQLDLFKQLSKLCLSHSLSCSFSIKTVIRLSWLSY